MEYVFHLYIVYVKHISSIFGGNERYCSVKFALDLDSPDESASIHILEFY